jgi:diguanylate cyclase (GGDEF)-like protein
MMKEVNRTPRATMDGPLTDLESAFRVAVDLCEEGICLVESSGDIVFANWAVLSWMQKSPDRNLRDRIQDWLAVVEKRRFGDHVSRLTHGAPDEEATFSSQFIRDDGTQIPVELRIRCVGCEAAALFAIVARRLKADEPMEASAQAPSRNDPLTGLPDRDTLMDRLRTMLARDSATRRQFALLFIDVDEFKQVNDGFGHLVGDQVLREVAQRLASCVRSGDHLARFGGDEFVVLVDGIGTGGGAVRAVVNRIRAAFRPSFALPARDVQLSVSVGVAEPSITCATAEDLLQVADDAMYAAKRGGA